MKPFANTVLAVTALALPAVPMLADEPGDLDTLKARVDKIEADAAAKPDSGKWYDAIEFAFGATGIVQGSSNAGSLSEDGDSSAASGSIDLELTAPATEGGFLSLHMESGSGAGLDGKIGTLSGLNDDADDDSNLRLTEAWFEQSFADVFRFRIGKIDLTTDFDTNAVANDETAQFLSSGFVNGLATEFPDDNGFGAMLWYSPFGTHRHRNRLRRRRRGF
jgi:carbohydrate-selective porin OprB